MTSFPSLKNSYYIRRLAPFLIVYLVYRIVYCLVKKAVRDALREYEAEKGVALTAKRVETAEPERGNTPPPDKTEE